eukprot:5194276-Prorocentrum_lima.AAC.1
MSTTTFCLSLHRVFENLSLDKQVRIWAYADDVVVAVPPALADNAMSALETGLAEVGLDMALHKTQIWLTGTEQLPP